MEEGIARYVAKKLNKKHFIHSQHQKQQSCYVKDSMLFADNAVHPHSSIIRDLIVHMNVIAICVLETNTFWCVSSKLM